MAQHQNKPAILNKLAPLSGAIQEQAEKETPGTEMVRRHQYGKVTAESLQKFLDIYRECGHKANAAVAAGLSYESVRRQERVDPAFKSLVEQAHGLFVHEVLESAAIEQGVTGISEPIIGGPNRDVIVGYKRVVQPRILELLLKRHDPEYREKQQLDVNHNVGVTLVAGPKMDEDAFEKLANAYAGRSNHTKFVKNEAESLPKDESGGTVEHEGNDRTGSGSTEAGDREGAGDADDRGD